MVVKRPCIVMFQIKIIQLMCDNVLLYFVDAMVKIVLDKEEYIGKKQ